MRFIKEATLLVGALQWAWYRASNVNTSQSGFVFVVCRGSERRRHRGAWEES
ncbi:hypothetical protein [Aidingimonas lacisalsi]|uniref:hypothetical protein n=1 Tax=Aidingimonas lacisalsi TaxID=2604086 RepID=UPI0013764A6F|nr:hypothetical protein [Aidingimonas lacisalsi]